MPLPSSRKSSRWFEPPSFGPGALSAAIGLFLGLAAVALGETVKCRVCEKPITGKFYRTANKAYGPTWEICEECLRLEFRCFACGLPVKLASPTLPDGRCLCARCTQEAVLEDETAKSICLAARDDLDRLLWRYLNFPQTNILLTIVDRFTLEGLLKSPGYDRDCSVILGATQTHVVGGSARIHAITILSGLNKIQFEAVAAHEFAHAWINDNLSTKRKANLSPDALEGFCEFIAYTLMEDRGAVVQKLIIKDNAYTHGQVSAFLTAESLHGFNAILDWMKSGASNRLDATDPDCVRDCLPAESPLPPPPTRYGAVTSPPLILPDQLTLRSISGTATRRFAIINDQTFGPSDRARIWLAGTNRMIHCLEIRTNSVLIRFEDSGLKQELRVLEK